MGEQKNQKECLELMCKLGYSVFVDPNDFIDKCYVNQLIPTDSIPFLSVEATREFIFNLALDHDRLPFLAQIIREWASGEYSPIGCDCKTILNWIWNRVTLIKESIETITRPLFQGENIDEKLTRQLYSHQVRLRSLSVLLKALIHHGSAATEQGFEELETRREVVTLIGYYLQMILWLHRCGLLPEGCNSESEEILESENYPREQLSQSYYDLRNEFPSNTEHDFLLIDGIITNLDLVSQRWRDDGGDGFYPPPNIYSLVNIYLIDSIQMDVKHMVMLYFLLDIGFLLKEKKPELAERIKKFPSAFNLKFKLSKLVEAFWYMDHRFYHYALTNLRIPEIQTSLNNFTSGCGDLGDELYYRVITTLNNNYRHKDANHLLVRNGPFQMNSLERQRTYLYVLLKNHQLLSALKFVRSNRPQLNADELLMHFLHICDEMNMMSKLFKMVLDPLEEEGLIYYLLNFSLVPNSKYLLCLYFMLTGRAMDAAKVRDTYRDDIENSESPPTIEAFHQISDYIDQYLMVLPASLKKLADNVDAIVSDKMTDLTMSNQLVPMKRCEPIKIKPKSSNVRTIAPSDLVLNAIEEIENNAKPDMTPLTEFKQKIKSKGIMLASDSPFMRSPVSTVKPVRRRVSIAPTVHVRDETCNETFDNSINASASSEVSFTSPCQSLNNGQTRSKRTPRGKGTPRPKSSEITSLLETPPIRRMTRIRDKNDSMRDGAISPALSSTSTTSERRGRRSAKKRNTITELSTPKHHMSLRSSHKKER